MNKYVGLWVDHRKAVIILLIDKKATVSHIESNMEGRTRIKGGSRSKTPYGPQKATSESRCEERYKQHLEGYYDRIVKLLDGTKAIFIFGPGAAKNELKNKIEKHKALASKIAGVDTTDKMTDPQIAAKVKKFFEQKG